MSSLDAYSKAVDMLYYNIVICGTTPLSRCKNEATAIIWFGWNEQHDSMMQSLVNCAPRASKVPTEA